MTFSPRRARQPDARIREEQYEKIKQKGKEIFEKSKEELKSTLYENIKVIS